MGDRQSLGLGGNAVNAHQGCQVQGVKSLLDSRPGSSGEAQRPFPKNSPFPDHASCPGTGLPLGTCLLPQDRPLARTQTQIQGPAPGYAPCPELRPRDTPYWRTPSPGKCLSPGTRPLVPGPAHWHAHYPITTPLAARPRPRTPVPCSRTLGTYHASKPHFRTRPLPITTPLTSRTLLQDTPIAHSHAPCPEPTPGHAPYPGHCVKTRPLPIATPLDSEHHFRTRPLPESHAPCPRTRPHPMTTPLPQNPL